MMSTSGKYREFEDLTHFKYIEDTLMKEEFVCRGNTCGMVKWCT